LGKKYMSLAVEETCMLTIEEFFMTEFISALHVTGKKEAA